MPQKSASPLHQREGAVDVAPGFRAKCKVHGYSRAPVTLELKLPVNPQPQIPKTLSAITKNRKPSTPKPQTKILVVILIDTLVVTASNNHP